MSSYARLSAESMRTISALWLRDPIARNVLEAHAKTAALLPDVEEVHDELCRALGGDDASPLEALVEKLRAEGGALDERHDRKYRGTWKLFDALLELADKPDTAASLMALRDRLQPNGLVQVNATWASEAGNATTVRDALDRETRAALKRIATVEGRTLDEEVHAWVTAGESLGPVASKKAAAEHQLANAGADSDTPALHATRLAWIKIARALEANLELVKGLTAEDRSRVLGLLHQAASSAERRSAARRKGDVEPTTPTKAPADG